MTAKNYVGMALCFFCGEPKDVLLERRLKPTLPPAAVYDREPCANCAKLMLHGIILISTRDDDRSDNPYRTGGFVVITADALSRIVNDPTLVAHILTVRYAFVPDAVWQLLGLPKGEEHD